MELRSREKKTCISNEQSISKDEEERNRSKLTIVNTKSLTSYKKDQRSNSVFKIGCHDQSKPLNQNVQKKTSKIVIKEEIFDKEGQSELGVDEIGTQEATHGAHQLKDFDRTEVEKDSHQFKLTVDHIDSVITTQELHVEKSEGVKMKDSEMINKSNRFKTKIYIMNINSNSLVNNEPQSVELMAVNDSLKRSIPTVNEPDFNENCIAKDLKLQLESKFKDFAPVNLINTVIPELFHQNFPIPQNRDGMFVCQWCERNRSEINKAIYNDSMLLVRHYIKHHSDIPVRDYKIQCKDCKAYFFHEKRLELHQQNGLCHAHNLQKDYNSKGRPLTMDVAMAVCPHCEMIFLSKKRFRKHFNSDGNSCKFETIDHPMEMGMFDYLKCKFCEENFLFENDFKGHLQPFQGRSNIEIFKCRNVSKPILTCSVCQQEFLSETKYKQHLSSDHTVEEFNISCERCGKFFYTEWFLTDHQEMFFCFPYCFDYDDCRTIPKRPGDERYNYLQSRIFKFCPVCNEKLNDTKRFTIHMKNLHPDFNSPWVCSDCDMTFMSVHEYENHITKWKCPFCSEISNTRAMLVIHCRKVHSKTKNMHLIYGKADQPSVCEICGATRQNEYSMQQHKSTVHMNLSECPLCGETDDLRINMLKHVATHAYKPPLKKSFSCDLCENKQFFTSKQRLKRHVDQVHNKAENTVCDICNRTFAQKATMMRHRRIHLDIKPFKCSICDLPFTQKTGMKAHKARHYNKDGSLKSPEEIKLQVEIIKQQRETLENTAPSEEKKKKRNRKKYPCEKCKTEFKSKNKYDSHPCCTEPETEEEFVPSDHAEENSVDHQTVHQYELSCDVCKKFFASLYSLGRHRCKRKTKQYAEDKKFDFEYESYDEKGVMTSKANDGLDNPVFENGIENPQPEQYPVKINIDVIGNPFSETGLSKVSSGPNNEPCKSRKRKTRSRPNKSPMVDIVEKKVKRSKIDGNIIKKEAVPNQRNEKEAFYDILDLKKSGKLREDKTLNTENFRDKYALRSKVPSIEENMSLKLKKVETNSAEIAKIISEDEDVILTSNDQISNVDLTGVNDNQKEKIVASTSSILEANNGIDLAAHPDSNSFKDNSVAKNDNKDEFSDDLDQESSEVNAKSFVDMEGGFNCRKCRAMFCDTEVFRDHKCVVFKS